MQLGHIIAEVRLTTEPTAENFGGEPISSYPTILTIGNDSFSSQALLENKSLVRPGAILRVSFRFLFPEAALLKLTVAAEFTIWERSKVGQGRVLEVSVPA